LPLQKRHQARITHSSGEELTLVWDQNHARLQPG
jgi:hypothetical protein